MPPKALKVASIVKFYALLLLSEKPHHGYELMKELEVRIGKGISPSQVYPFLETLEDEKLIQAQKTGVREKTVYSLTKSGKGLTSSMISRAGDLFYLAIKPRVSVCTHCGCKVLEGGHREKRNGKEMVFCCHHCAKSFNDRLRRS